MKKMRQKTKTVKMQTKVLLLSLLLTILLSTLIGLTALSSIEKMGEQDVGKKALCISQSAATAIDGDKFEAVTKNLDEKDSFYQSTNKMLNTIKNKTK